MTNERVERRLAAILVADLAGYSRLMHNDEEATHARLTTLMADTVLPAIARHGGRVVKSTGDGFLADFPSAVRAETQFQDRVHELAIGETEDMRRPECCRWLRNTPRRIWRSAPSRCSPTAPPRASVNASTLWR